MQNKEIAAVYCRLSQDDGSVGESGSIQTQKTLLTQYCQEHHIEIGDYYCDDGWSGTNFDRPEFKRMLEDIESEKVNLVIVKDLSRFGREYAQMGLYIEHYFEEKASDLSRWRKTSTQKTGLTVWYCPSPMSSIPSMHGRLLLKPRRRTGPGSKAECISGAGRPSVIKKTPMTVTI